MLAVAVPLVVLALGLILWVSVGRALRPVEVMREEADTITAAHLRRRLPVPPGDDEIPRLARTLNEMLDRIDEGQRLQRQFVSDASHELRSPLAVIRQAAEVARALPGPGRARRRSPTTYWRESERLEQLVTALLLLARLEGDDRSQGETVDLDDLVLDRGGPGKRAGARGSRSTPTAWVPAACAGSAVLLGQVVRNLLDNACRHARDARSRSAWPRRAPEVVLDVDRRRARHRCRRSRAGLRALRPARRRPGARRGRQRARAGDRPQDRRLAAAAPCVVGDAPAGGARFTVRLPRVAD